MWKTRTKRTKSGTKKAGRLVAKRIATGKTRFLKHLRACGSVTVAAARAGLGRTALYEWRQADPEFAREWVEASELAYDDLEAGILERAKNGSDTLAIFVAKARWPQYRERYERSIKNDPEIRALVSGIAAIIKEFVPPERLRDAVLRVLNLVDNCPDVTKFGPANCSRPAP